MGAMREGDWVERKEDRNKIDNCLNINRNRMGK